MILTQGYYTIVDDDDFEKIGHISWSVHIQCGRPYARASINNKPTPLHLVLMPPKDGLMIDHKDGNSLNNQRSNLRYCTFAQNIWNKIPYKGFTTKGISFRSGKYNARAVDGDKRIWIGRYKTKQEALDAYDKKAEELYGEFAYLNRNRHLYVDPHTFYDERIDKKFGFKKGVDFVEGYDKLLK